MTYPLPAFIGGTVEVWEWTSHFIPYFKKRCNYLSIVWLQLFHKRGSRCPSTSMFSFTDAQGMGFFSSRESHCGSGWCSWRSRSPALQSNILKKNKNTSCGVCCCACSIESTKILLKREVQYICNESIHYPRFPLYPEYDPLHTINPWYMDEGFLTYQTLWLLEIVCIQISNNYSGDAPIPRSPWS